MEFNPLPKELLVFSHIFYTNGIPRNNSTFNEVLTNKDSVLAYLEKRYESYYKDKVVCEEKYLDYLYKDKVNAKQYGKYLQVNFLSLIKCFNESIFYLENVNIKTGPTDIEKVNYANKLFGEIVIFLNEFETFVNKDHIPYGYYRRNISLSYELYYSSFHHYFSYCNPLTFASITMQPLAVFQIRQAIEVRIKNALGIHILRRKSNYDQLKITPDVFIEFIYSRPTQITIEVDKNVLQKIHSWTNLYIHTGFMPQAYKIWYAIKKIEPLFSYRTVNGYDDRYGSITINKEYYNNELENDIQNYVFDNFGKKLSIDEASDIYIEKLDPEAVLI